MKKVYSFLGVALILFLMGQYALALNDPICTQDDKWETAISNALMVADDYAIENNPNAVFAGKNIYIRFVKQIGGKFEGNYLLLISNKLGSDISFAGLLPLFDVNQPLGEVSNKPLWKVVMAKFNGIPF